MKNTVVPGSVGLALPGYVGLAGQTSATVTLTGSPGYWVSYELDGPNGLALYGDGGGYLDASGNLTVTFNFVGYPDGVYTVAAQQVDKYGNWSAVQSSTPTLTLDTVTPTGSFTTSAIADEQPGDHADAQLRGRPHRRVPVPGLDERRLDVVGVAGVQHGRRRDAPVARRHLRGDGQGRRPRREHLHRDAERHSRPHRPDAHDIAVRCEQRDVLRRRHPDHVDLERDRCQRRPDDQRLDRGPDDLVQRRHDRRRLPRSPARTRSRSRRRTRPATRRRTRSRSRSTPPRRASSTRSTTAAARGWITASFKPSLVTQIQNVIKERRTRRRSSAASSACVQGGTTTQITAAYKTLLLNWANDLLARL